MTDLHDDLSFSSYGNGMRLVVPLLFAIAPAFTATAQPADCPAQPAANQSLPLWLSLNNLPGVPRGIAGYMPVEVPAPPPGGTVCITSRPSLPRDILRGAPEDLL